MKNKLDGRAQMGILTQRYGATMVGDWATIALLLAQAPFIGYLCTVVWGSVETDTPSLYFVLCLSALWFGCIGACREIVRERAILERERFFGLSLMAYIQSKINILAVIGLLQVLLLQMAVEWKLALKGVFLVQSLTLWMASLAGTALGLVVSALSKSQERAVGAIPLLILPQILFSEFTIPDGYLSTAATWVERFMPVHWAYTIFQELAQSQPDIKMVFFAFGILAIMIMALACLAMVVLIPRRDL